VEVAELKICDFCRKPFEPGPNRGATIACQRPSCQEANEARKKNHRKRLNAIHNGLRKKKAELANEGGFPICNTCGRPILTAGYRFNCPSCLYNSSEAQCRADGDWVYA